MLVTQAIAEILKKERTEYLSCFPTTPVIEAAAEVGIRPIICRQERVGVGIADGYARVTNGRTPAVFAMQYGPGVENAYPGIATAYSDSSPVLLLPLGHSRAIQDTFPLFSSMRSLGSVTKSVEQLVLPERLPAAMRRAFSKLQNGRPGPVMVEIPEDVAALEIDPALIAAYRPAPVVRSMGDSQEISAAAESLLRAERPVILAGAGVLYGEAWDELTELAEYLQVPVVTTMEGKSAFSEVHPLALGSISGVMSGPAFKFFGESDLVLAIGTSLTIHGMVTPIPAGKRIIHTTNDPADIGKSYDVDHAILGDAKHVLRQLIEVIADMTGDKPIDPNDGPAAEIDASHSAWMASWIPLLESDERPINPYRVIREFMWNVDPAEAIVTHDSGNPRFEIMPFYRSNGPRTYLGWGKSHQLGTGLGLAIGAKLAEPEKICVNFMGDAAFGMTGLDFETAVRSDLPITTIVLNNGTMAVEEKNMDTSHALYGTRDLGGGYADIARSLGGWSERVDSPADVGPAILRAVEANRNGEAALLEFMTSEESAYSHMRPFS
ncbi:MAG: thiamine pyrophosphate-requiring protein [Chloroflexi bacterium]|nr:thiamine pyrophosphate-requiring protein [Chloroflexota bacterium]